MWFFCRDSETGISYVADQEIQNPIWHASGKAKI